MSLSNRAKNLLLLALSICIPLGIGEAVLRYKDSRSIRIVGRHKMPPFRRHHPVYHHGLVPAASGTNTAKGEFRAFYQINSLGMRDRGYPRAKPSSTYRILALGDSFTEGYSSDLADSFIKRLERRLNARPPKEGITYEVANLGVASFSPLLEFLRLKEFVDKLPGDFVLLNFDGSDFADDHFYEKGAVQDGDENFSGWDMRASFRPTRPAAVTSWNPSRARPGATFTFSGAGSGTGFGGRTSRGCASGWAISNTTNTAGRGWARIRERFNGSRWDGH